MIEKGSKAQIRYALFLEDGTQVDGNADGEPLELQQDEIRFEGFALHPERLQRARRVLQPLLVEVFEEMRRRGASSGQMFMRCGVVGTGLVQLLP